MFQRRFYVLRRLHNLFDAILVMAVFLLVYLLRSNLAQVHFLEELGKIHPFEHYAPLMLISALLWPIVLNHHGLYDPTPLRKAYVNIGIIVRSSLVATLALITFIYLFQIETISRLFVGGFGLFTTLVLMCKELFRRRYLLRSRLSGRDVRPVLIVGTIETVRQAIAKIREENYLGLKPVAAVLPAGEKGEASVHGVPIVGELTQWRKILHDHPVASVLFTIYHVCPQEIEKALWVCQEEGVDSWIVANAFGWNLPHLEVDYLAEIPVLMIRTTPPLSWAYVFKLLFDRMLAVLLLIALSPLFLWNILMILLTAGRPVFYRQRRVGRFGQAFELYKFRTLDDGEKKAKGFRQWLRQTGLDEIPQLINIIKGEMSFVGPRPHIPEEVDCYENPWQRRRFSVLPGLTCYRQILRPDKVSFNEAMALDLKYVDHWSLGADFFLLFKTFLLLLRRLF